MKLWIFLALIGLSAAAPSRKFIVKKVYDEVAGCWVADKIVTDPDEIAAIMAERGDSITRVDGKTLAETKVGDVVNGEPIPCNIAELKGPAISLPKAKINAPSQTKKVIRKPCFRGYAPVTLKVDGVSWRCTHVGRSQRVAPCLPNGRVLNRACEKSITPCAAPEIVIVDEPCIAEVTKKVVAPCETKVVVPCETKVVVPCETKVVVPCETKVTERKIVAPCLDFKLPEVKVSASAGAGATASVGDHSVSASANVKLPEVDLSKMATGCGGKFSASFKSSASASASAQSSSSFSSSSSSSVSTSTK
uniref:uncharacterized protein LOC120348361 n=1 Tax=Styela clava TaxID=7725 RepID=UPI0019397F01|nr:uncharacterized protein LOC120348361 [Styela clava]